jgi:CMP-N,N'-diacetyllegionaminic acid synthase
MIRWTTDEANKSKWLNFYGVCSDDVTILDASGVVAWIQEPPVPDVRSRMISLNLAIAEVERINRKTYDYIVDIRATSPLKTAYDIDGAIQLLVESGAESVIGVTPLEDHHPARAKWLDEQGRIHDFIPEPADGLRQNLKPAAYIRNGCIYAYRRDVLMGDNVRQFGHEFILGYVMPAERSVNIDTELDWKLAEVLMNERTA